MRTWLKIAVRNLIKNGRRSCFTVLAIGTGFAAVNVFGGFTEYVFKNLKDSFIYAQANGHLTVFKKGFLTEGKIDPLKFVLTPEEVEKIRDVCRKDGSVLCVTPQLQIMGLLSNSKISTIFIGIGRVPSDLEFVQKQATGLMGKLIHHDGKPLRDDTPSGVGLSAGLAAKLKLTLDSDAIAMATTVEGQVNALDVQVFNLFHSPVEDLEDKLMLAPLQFAQTLYDTSSVDRITILLKPDADGREEKDRFARLFQEQGLDVEISSWEELSTFYAKVKDMFNVIFMFVFVIVFIIVVMSVVNTISMSIVERTREIGTLRALGLKRRGVMKLFAIESAMLGVIGSSFGVLLTLAGWLLVKIIEPTWVPPNIVRRIPLEVLLVPHYMIFSSIFLITLSTLSSLPPTRKAAHRSIVDALGHV